MPRLAIIGGSGVYDPAIFKVKESKKVQTPYGSPSAPIEIGELDGLEVAFLPRHGKGHVIPPHKINYRANIFALKSIGVERIITGNACGSLKEEYKPGEIAIVDQFIDWTKRRELTFLDGGRVAHVSAADPVCPELHALANKGAKELKIPHHEKGAYVCIEGPRFSTRAESRMYRQFAEVIGMTAVPECFLAREQEICYCSLAMVTDYDVWADHPVTQDEVFRTMTENVEKLRRLVAWMLPKVPEKRKCVCSTAMQVAWI
ncbi:MAG TPA: S-methyl-5'-thioadenosine phosphorylase [Thermoplasmata archaeon]|nr:S-methyl-5'-thioadenosine phosphorylase [Thermoplasmata archaeon]